MFIWGNKLLNEEKEMRLKSYIETHLEDRDVKLNDKRFPVMVDKENDVAYFPLFNLSGKFVGYQRYRNRFVQNG